MNYANSPISLSDMVTMEARYSHDDVDSGEFVAYPGWPAHFQESVPYVKDFSGNAHEYNVSERRVVYGHQIICLRQYMTYVLKLDRSTNHGRVLIVLLRLKKFFELCLSKNMTSVRHFHEAMLYKKRQMEEVSALMNNSGMYLETDV